MSQSDKRKVLGERYKTFSSKISVLTLGDKLNQVPGEKAFWAMTLSEAEAELRSLEIQKNNIVKELQKKVIEQSQVNLTKNVLNNLKNDELLADLNNEIDELKLTIKYVDRIYDCVKYIAKDFENILKFLQLQEG